MGNDKIKKKNEAYVKKKIRKFKRNEIIWKNGKWKKDFVKRTKVENMKRITIQKEKIISNITQG